MTAVMANPPGPSLIETLTQEASGNMSFRYVVWQQLQRSTSPKGSISKKKSVSGTKVVCPARWRRVCFALAFARLARLRFLVSDAMCKPVLRRDRLDFGYDNRFQNPTICSRRLPCSLNLPPTGAPLKGLSRSPRGRRSGGETTPNHHHRTYSVTDASRGAALKSSPVRCSVPALRVRPGVRVCPRHIIH